MPAKVTLTVVKGPSKGQETIFEERTSCIVGRSKECNPQIPDDEQHRSISRHHCMLDINPPDVRVRDFGSLNGTWVNDLKIGQREKGMSADEGKQMSFPEHDLKDGDRVRLSNTTFRVELYVPAVCETCEKEIAEADRQKMERAPGVFRCEPCHRKAIAAKQKPPAVKKKRQCAKCGKDVEGEIGHLRQGKYICVSCRADPMAILRLLLQKARSGQKDVLAIQGYDIVRELGRGGMGAVYLARHEQTGKHVALKVMLPQVAASRDATEKFLREVANSKALQHPNVVQLFDSGCSNGTFFFTLEYCDGGSVDRLMAKQGGKLPIDDALRIALQSLDGLEYSHHVKVPEVKLKDGRVKKARGLVHRDLKPGNIFLCGSGPNAIAKIADYGMSKAFDKAGLSGQTRTGTAAGTPAFMPRQQVVNFKYSKPPVDVWAMRVLISYGLSPARAPSL